MDAKTEMLLTNKADELLRTEKIYCHNLQLLVDHYYMPLLSRSNTDEKLLDPSQINTVFSNIETIRTAALQLLQELTRCIEQERSWRLGSIFCNLGRALQSYSQFMSNFGKASACLHEMSTTSKDFAEWLHETSLEVKASTGNARDIGKNIRDLLIKPLQRVPRYELMLREMQSVLSKNGTPDAEVQQAIELVHEVAAYNNTVIKEEEDRQRLYEVQAKLPTHDIVNVDRRCIKIGDLQMIGHKKRKPYKLILLNDALLTVTALSRSQYKLHHTIELADPAVNFSLRTEEHTNNIAICAVSKVKSFLACCNTPTETKEWFQILTQTQQALLSSSSLDRNGGNQIAYDPAIKRPIWTPDAALQYCELCRLQFTWANRRHHCRVCGKLVCSTCSPHRANLGSDKAERVCTTCELVKQDGGSYHVAADASHREKLSDSAQSLAQTQTLDAIRMCGFLEKKGGTGKNDDKQRVGVFGRRNWKKRWFVLRSTVLQYYASPEDNESLGSLLLTENKLIVDFSSQRIVLSSDTRDFNLRLVDATDQTSFLKWTSELEYAIAESKRMQNDDSSNSMSSAMGDKPCGLSGISERIEPLESGSEAESAPIFTPDNLHIVKFDRAGPLGIEIFEVVAKDSGQIILIVRNKDPQKPALFIQNPEGADSSMLATVQERSIMGWTFQDLVGSGLLKQRPLTLGLMATTAGFKVETEGALELAKSGMDETQIPAAEGFVSTPEAQGPARVAESNMSGAVNEAKWPCLWSRSLVLCELATAEDGMEVPAVMILLRTVFLSRGGLQASQVFKQTQKWDEPTKSAAKRALEETGQLPAGADSYLAAVLLLDFFREFPGGLLAGLNSDMFSRLETEDDAVNVLGKIDDIKQQMFAFLLDLVSQVARNEAETGMSSEILAAEIASSVCGSVGLQPDDEHLQLFIYLLIEYWGTTF